MKVKMWEILFTGKTELIAIPLKCIPKGRSFYQIERDPKQIAVRTLKLIYEDEHYDNAVKAGADPNNVLAAPVDLIVQGKSGKWLLHPIQKKASGHVLAEGKSLLIQADKPLKMEAKEK